MGMFQPSERIGDERVKIGSYDRSMLDFNAPNITAIDDWVVDAFSVSFEELLLIYRCLVMLTH